MDFFHQCVVYFASRASRAAQCVISEIGRWMDVHLQTFFGCEQFPPRDGRLLYSILLFFLTHHFLFSRKLTWKCLDKEVSTSKKSAAHRPPNPPQKNPRALSSLSPPAEAAVDGASAGRVNSGARTESSRRERRRSRRASSNQRPESKERENEVEPGPPWAGAEVPFTKDSLPKLI